MELASLVWKVATFGFGLSFIGALGTTVVLMGVGLGGLTSSLALFLGLGVLAVGSILTGLLRWGVLRNNRRGMHR